MCGKRRRSRPEPAYGGWELAMPRLSLITQGLSRCRGTKRAPGCLPVLRRAGNHMAKKSSRKRGSSGSERKFRLLVEGVIDYAIYMLDPNGIITNWNAGARRIKGYEADEGVGRPFQMFYPEEDRAAGFPA